MYEVDRILIAKKKQKNKNFLSKFWSFLKKKIFLKKDKKISKFSGWGLEINHSEPPWNNKPTKDDLIFLDTNERLLKKIIDKKFKLTQFDYFDTNYAKILNELKWRHYIIFNACTNLIKNNGNKKKNLIECGVCDGLTFFFISNALKSKNVDFNGFLFDSWSKFSFDNKKDIFDYSYLNVDTARNNLIDFKKNLSFIEGNIPETFKNYKNPEKIDLIHIDLNSSEATLNTLNFFYEKVNSGGIIIFDDYARIVSEKEVIDKFFFDKEGNFVSFPTGQLIFIKK